MTKLDSSEARNRTQFAISSGSAIRWSGFDPAYSSLQRLGIIGLVEKQVRERRVDEAWADAVRPDPTWRELERE